MKLPRKERNHIVLSLPLHDKKGYFENKMNELPLRISSNSYPYSWLCLLFYGKKNPKQLSGNFIHSFEHKDSFLFLQMLHLTIFEFLLFHNIFFYCFQKCNKNKNKNTNEEENRFVVFRLEIHIQCKKYCIIKNVRV